MAKKPSYEELEQKVKALQQSVEKYRLLVEQIPATTYIAELDKASTTLYISPQVEKLIGFSQTEWRNDADIWRKQLYPEDRERVLAEVARSQEANEPFISEYRMLARDGHVVWFRDEAVIVRDTDGKPLYLQGVMSDITDRKRTEEALRLSEARLRAAIDSLPFDFFMLDENGRYVMQSAGSFSHWGDIRGKRPEDLAPDESTLALWEESNRRAFAGEVVKGEVEFKAPKEHKFFYNIISPIRDAGKIRGILGLNIDITDIKQAEESLRKSEEEKANILETMSELVIHVDTDMKILWGNRAAADSVGLTADALIGKYCYKEWFQASEPCSFCPAKKIFETGQPQEGETYSPDGRAWHFRGYPVKDENGKIIGIVEVVEDITERKQAEALIIEKSRDLECILDNAPIGLSYLDPEMRIVRINRFAERKFGLKSEEIRSQYCYDVLGQYANDDTRKGKDRICDACQVVKTLEDGKIHTHERVIRPDYIIRNTSAPIKDQNGKTTGAIEMIEDITALKRAEEEKKKIEALFQAAQKTEAIGTLAGGIAHDFNNLLTTIQGTASLMLFDVDSTHPHYERLQTITKQVQRGASLTAQLLGYASKGRYEVKPISLNRIVEETSDTFGRTHKEITIHLELTEDLSSIEADRPQIEQVLLNLYINASGAMPRGGTLTLKTVNVTHNDIKDIAHNPRSGSYALLTVTDTGTGMDKEVRERIFEPFFTTKQMGRGTGLGLASAYGIIKGHRGYIHVDSEKGRGTIFSIYLPASAKEVVTVIKSAGQVIEGSGTILLVDDEDPVLEVGVMMLEKTGYTVLEAKGGREAVEIYEANKDKIDLVILDMIMPDMGGGEAYDKMKEINPNVKVLLSSGYSIEGEATEILDRGCDGFIQKPFNINKLSEKIREILDTG